MNNAEINALLRDIYKAQLAQGGAYTATVLAEFYRQVPNIDELLGPDLVRSLLKQRTDKIVADTGRENNCQQVLEGVLEWDETVTVADAEGGYGRKLLSHASDDDLLFDLDQHVSNELAAKAALTRARDRNDTLLPVMHQHGFATAGEAIEFLRRSAS